MDYCYGRALSNPEPRASLNLFAYVHESAVVKLNVSFKTYTSRGAYIVFLSQGVFMVYRNMFPSSWPRDNLCTSSKLAVLSSNKIIKLIVPCITLLSHRSMTCDAPSNTEEAYNTAAPSELKIRFEVRIFYNGPTSI